MAYDLARLHAQAGEQTRRFLAAIPADAWAHVSNCPPWTVRDLVNHLVAENWWTPELIHGKSIAEVGDRFDGDVLGDDPLAAYDASQTVAQAALDEPGAMDAPCAVSYGPVPGSVYAAHRLIDVAIHGWDFAASTGQDARLPDDLVQALWDLFKDQAEDFGRSGYFKPNVAVPPDADLQTRLLAIFGRQA